LVGRQIGWATFPAAYELLWCCQILDLSSVMQSKMNFDCGDSHDAEFAFQAGQRVGAQAGAWSILFIVLSFFRCDVGQDLFFEPLGAVLQ
jgi:hypothetical protein